jgi:putative membrane protein
VIRTENRNRRGLLTQHPSKLFRAAKAIRMIQNFGDHAANERTFLAWVRTSIAVIAFGFLVERFDLFLRFAASASLKNHDLAPNEEFGQLAGLILIVLGVIMILIAAHRFVRTAKEIDDEEKVPGTGSRADLALASLLVILIGALLFYLIHAWADQGSNRGIINQRLTLSGTTRSTANDVGL